MTRLRISHKAEADLASIARYGIEPFGIARSVSYRDRIIDRLRAITQNPERYPRADHIRPGNRRSVFGMRSIYYKTDKDVVYVVRILSRQVIGVLKSI